MNFVRNHAPGAGSIARPVTELSSAYYERLYLSASSMYNRNLKLLTHLWNKNDVKSMSTHDDFLKLIRVNKTLSFYFLDCVASNQSHSIKLGL